MYLYVCVFDLSSECLSECGTACNVCVCMVVLVVDRGDRNTGMRGHARSIRLLGGGLGCSVVGIMAEQTVTLHSNIFSIWQADRQTETYAGS